MCGIAGLIGQPDIGLLRAMIARLSHRGPDDHGARVIGSAGVACARLSLVDFDRGRQPLDSDAGRLVVAFNGEIYNHDALRAELRAGHRCVFRGRSDTEVLLRGFECEGTRFLSRLEGMFALAITDGRTLWLARDSFGMKPLFYWASPDARRFLFASEAKALFADRSVPKSLDRTALAEFATFGFPLGGHTLFESIVQLAPGEVVEVAVRPGAALHIYRGSVAHAPAQPFDGTQDEAVETLTGLLRQSVRQQLAADHPVGCFLSGGIDSSLVVGLAGEVGRRAAFTAGDTLDEPDVGLARQVAAHADAAHELIRLDPDLFIASIPAAVAAAELPISPTLAFLCAPAVRRATKAVLCGDGADELFGGYDVHAQPDRLLARYKIAFGYLSADTSIDRRHLESSRAVLDWLDSGAADERQRRIYDFLGGDQLSNYHLWIWDRGSMASGLEVRLPFLDTRLRALANAIPFEWRVRHGVTKMMLRKLLARVLPPALADAVVNQKKRAAWYSGRRCLRAFQDRAAQALAADERRSHPFHAFFPHAAGLALFDLFLLIFFAGDDLSSPSFTLEDFYRTRRDDLREILKSEV